MKKDEKINLLVFTDESNLDSSTLLIGSIAIEKKLFENMLSKIKKEHGDLEKLPELHFNQYQQADHKKRKLANSYIDLISQKNIEKYLFFNIVIADKSRLDKDFNKSKDKEKKVERIFTRLALTYAINRFSCRYKRVIVEKILVDKGGKTDDNFFRDYAISKIRTKSKAEIPDKLDFINSDPRKEVPANSKYSVFIDITDLILGACRNCCCNNKATNRYKKEITEKIFNDVLIKLIKNRSKYGKINTYPQTKKVTEYKEKLISGETVKKKKYHYKENEELKKKCVIKPYNQINNWGK